MPIVCSCTGTPPCSPLYTQLAGWVAAADHPISWKIFARKLAPVRYPRLVNRVRKCEVCTVAHIGPSSRQEIIEKGSHANEIDMRPNTESQRRPKKTRHPKIHRHRTVNKKMGETDWRTLTHRVVTRRWDTLKC